MNDQLFRRILTTSLLLVTVALTACGRLPFSGPEPTGQPVAVVPGEATGQFSPTITLSPPNGYAGLYIQVTGAGWPPNMMVIVVLSDPSGISTTVATKDTDGSGNLATGFLYPIDARWLLDTPYTVAAESADGKYQATSAFQVVEPGQEAAPTTVATVAAAPTATAMPTTTTVPPTAIPASASPAPTAPPAPTATPQPVVAATANATSSGTNQPPVIQAVLAPDGERGKPHQRYVVEVSVSDPNNNLSKIETIIMIPPLDALNDVNLKDKDKIEIKMDRGKFEVSAPNAEATFAFIQEYSGIQIQPGQRIEYKVSPDHRFKATFKDGLWKIDASELLITVIAADNTGLSSKVTISPTNSSNDDNDHADDKGTDNKQDDDDDDDDNKKNGPANGNGNERKDD